MSKRKLWPSTIAFRLTDENRREVEKLARKSKITVSQYFREKVLDVIIQNSDKK